MLSSTDAPRIRRAYEKAMDKSSKFFEIRWVLNRPKVYIMANRETMKALRERKVADWIGGWTDENAIYILNVNKCKLTKKVKARVLREGYLSDLTHEIAHLFFLKVAKTHDTNPIWLWEGVSRYLDGHTKPSKDKEIARFHPSKFEDFLEYYDRHKLPGKENEAGVYRESGFVVEFLVKNYGKEKLLRLIRSIKDAGNEAAFAKKFKNIYGFELNYNNFNR
jgi:hypothetical protein